jgi:hypothetical protein
MVIGWVIRTITIELVQLLHFLNETTQAQVLNSFKNRQGNAVLMYNLKRLEGTTRGP